jgi:hypothetical protein
MNRIALSLLLVLTAAAVQAQPPEAPTAPVASEESRESQDATEPMAESAQETIVMAHEARDAAPRHCLQETGTRIKRRNRDGCTNGIGESYTGEELRRTGGRDTADALRLLSPRFGG